MTKTKIEVVPLPADSLVKNAFSTINYADAYRAKLPENDSHDLISVVNRFGSGSPRWIGWLMNLRNRLVSLIGLKTVKSNRSTPRTLTLEPGTKFGPFRVFQKTANEVLMGEDDTHLNFRVSILLQPEQASCWTTISTVVHYNNWLGRLYFMPVRPFHRLIVTTMLKNMVKPG